MFHKGYEVHINNGILSLSLSAFQYLFSTFVSLCLAVICWGKAGAKLSACVVLHSILFLVFVFFSCLVSLVDCER